ncbi:MAG: HDOD domain-containing protein [Steroidobacteraceae bacterium]|jgi:putative nucleotidyltransferase with HDIG domain|nr:HDOD domain-containing protein [Steroidobacteraceae bacterium]
MSDHSPPAGLAARIAADADRAFGRSLGQASAGAELWSALQREDIDAAAAARLIGGTPVLAATVMRVANSALFGRRGQVGSLQRAVTTLGLDAIRGVVLAASLRHVGRQAVPGLLDGDEWLQHSVATAIAARRLAEARLPPPEAELAFIAGLLHDLGWAVFASTQPEAMRACLAELAVSPVRGDPGCRAVEHRHFGLTHADCGALVADHWGLPVAIGAAIREHHGRNAADEGISPLGAILRLADAAASDRIMPLACEAGWDRPALSADQAESVTDLASETAGLLEALHPG